MSSRSHEKVNTGHALENGKKTKGRVKIKMEYIDDKVKRYTTFSKRKTGLMKKAYELSTLTGTQVMMLVASETGHVYTFATSKLKPMITSDAGKALIQTCLDSPDHLTATQEEPDAEMTEAEHSNASSGGDVQQYRVLNSQVWPEFVSNAVGRSPASDDERREPDRWPASGTSQSDSSSSLSWSGDAASSPAAAAAAAAPPAPAPAESPPGSGPVLLRPVRDLAAPPTAELVPGLTPVDYSGLSHPEVLRGAAGFPSSDAPVPISGASVIQRVDSARAGEVPTAAQPTDLSRSRVIVHL